MPSTSPFANFYDEVFVAATPEQQETFLRQLFTRNGSLCASFGAYINPPFTDFEEQQKHINSAVQQMREKIKRYHWDTLFDMNPLAEDYITELTDVINQEMIGAFSLKMIAFCATGDLLSALSFLRIIEQGTNLNWEELEEPASHHVDEVKEHIAYQFHFFLSSFQDYIFSVDLIKEAIAQMTSFTFPSGDYFDYSADWQDVLDEFKHQLEEND
ncbi:MAG: hypothetical protein DHS20C18_55730 [Saprospiraceae bacterium]|nr:MAG: hypothetical protein DHS20C18_55730 [Saprospiraceae bacterium]